MEDVNGDGNCLWYSLERLTAQDAKKIKQSSFSRLETLRTAWLQLHEAITPEIWSQLVFQQDQWGEFANEVSVASAATLLDRCVVVLSDAYITLFSRTHPIQEQVVRALVLNLHEQHYCPVLEKLPNEIATQLLTQGRSYSPSLVGGGDLSLLECWVAGTQMARATLSYLASCLCSGNWCDHSTAEVFAEGT